MGDSITHRQADKINPPFELQWRVDSGLYGEFMVRNYGVDGSGYIHNGILPYNSTAAYADVLAWHPDIIFLMLGTNDLKVDNCDAAGPDGFERDMRKLIRTLRSLPTQPTVFLSMPPPLRVEFRGIAQSRLASLVLPIESRVYQELAEANDHGCAPGAVHVLNLQSVLSAQEDLGSDGIHPNDQGRQLIALAYLHAMMHCQHASHISTTAAPPPTTEPPTAPPTTVVPETTPYEENEADVVPCEPGQQVSVTPADSDECFQRFGPWALLNNDSSVLTDLGQHKGECWVQYWLHLSRPGMYELHAEFPTNQTFAHNTLAKVQHVRGMATLTLDQRGPTTAVRLGAFLFDRGGGSVRLENTNTPAGYASVAGAVKAVCVAAPPSPPPAVECQPGDVFVWDNTDPAVQVTGLWEYKADKPGAYADDMLIFDPLAPGAFAATARVTYRLPLTLPRGHYDAAASFTASNSRSSAVLYEVKHAAGITMRLLNQQLNAELPDNFQPLGSFTLGGSQSGNLSIAVLAAGDDRKIVADAVKLTCVGPPEPANCPAADLQVWAEPGLCMATVSYQSPLDGVDTTTKTVFFTGIGPDQVFPVGRHTESYFTVDPEGSSTECSFDVVVHDREAPFLGCADIAARTVAQTAPGTCAAHVDLPNISAADNCGEVTVTVSDAHASGMFAVGLSTVVFWARDGASPPNEASCVHQVQVLDAEAPVFADCSALLQMPTDKDACGATLQTAIAAPTATDNCGTATVFQTHGPAPGSLQVLPLGNTSLSFAATDAAGNAQLCHMTLHVADQQPPTLSCPEPLIFQADTGTCAVALPVNAWPEPAAHDNCGVVTVAQVAGPTRGSLAAVGQHSVVYQGTDSAGLVAQCSFTVTVLDVERPALMDCPSDQTLTLEGGTSERPAPVLVPPRVLDNCAGAFVSPAASNAASLGVGEHMLSWMATDASGNTASCTTIVVVEPATTYTSTTPLGTTVTEPSLSPTSTVPPTTMTLGTTDSEPYLSPTTTEEPTTTVSPLSVSPTSVSPTSVSPASVSPTSVSPTSVSPTSVSPTSVSPTSKSPTSVSPTSLSPTSASPTSASPTSVSPTTASPTSASPTSVSPTSVSPTSVSPTSVSPTSVSPTSALPTSSASPTSASPTSALPTSASPTSASPTSMPPTSASATSASPTSLSPTSASPTSASPTSVSPTSASPTSTSATSASPTSTSPATVSPTTVSPTTVSPTTVSPTTLPTSASPTSASPTSASPTSASPTSASPTSASPTSASPTSASPTSASPTSASPASASPSTASPTSQSPTSASPTSASPTSASPTTQSPTSQSPTSESPTSPSTTTSPAWRTTTTSVKPVTDQLTFSAKEPSFCVTVGAVISNRNAVVSGKVAMRINQHARFWLRDSQGLVTEQGAVCVRLGHADVDNLATQMPHSKQQYLVRVIVDVGALVYVPEVDTGAKYTVELSPRMVFSADILPPTWLPVEESPASASSGGNVPVGTVAGAILGLGLVLLLAGLVWYFRPKLRQAAAKMLGGRSDTDHGSGQRAADGLYVRTPRAMADLNVSGVLQVESTSPRLPRASEPVVCHDSLYFDLLQSSGQPGRTTTPETQMDDEELSDTTGNNSCRSTPDVLDSDSPGYMCIDDAADASPAAPNPIYCTVSAAGVLTLDHNDLHDIDEL